jgi:hypothetical protein
MEVGRRYGRNPQMTRSLIEEDPDRGVAGRNSPDKLE